MKLNEAETLYMFGLVRYDLEELHRREARLRRLLDMAADRQKIDTLELKLARVVARIEIASALSKRLASDICLADLREKAKE